MKVILISGHAQNGKDTTAEILKDYLEQDRYSVLICHYGDLVKYVCKTFFNWNGLKDEKGRWLLQYVGTDIVRTQNPDYWVNFIEDMLCFFNDNWDYVIIPDARFPNEIETFKRGQFETIHIRVVRDGFTSPLTPEQQNHPSETALDRTEPDFWISNSGSINDLRGVIYNWAKEYLKIEEL